MEQPDKCIPVFHDVVVLFRAACEDGEAEFFIKSPGGCEVFDGEADGESAEMHGGVDFFLENVIFSSQS